MSKKKTELEPPEPGEKGYLATQDNTESPTLVVQWNKRRQGWPMSAIRTWEMLPMTAQLKISLSTDHEVLVSYEHAGDQDYYGLLDALEAQTIKVIYTTPKKSRVRVYQLLPDSDGVMERTELK